MTKNSTSPANSQWTGMVPVDDTALAVTDTGGPGIPVLYLNGQFSTQGYWRRVIAELGTEEWRHITYDERARGKSKRSADYSFAAAVRDVDAVLAARDVDRALLVGWSYGAVVAAHWPAGIWSVPWARSWSTARTHTTGSTRPWSSGSGSCSGG
jgi:alpha-beta hydrolase superfamily lysophospholipase